MLRRIVAPLRARRYLVDARSAYALHFIGSRLPNRHRLPFFLLLTAGVLLLLTASALILTLWWPQTLGNVADRFERATAIIGFGALIVTFLTLAAGIAELTIVFPNHRLTFDILALIETGSSDPPTSQVLLTVPENAPIMSTYRFKVELIDQDDHPVPCSGRDTVSPPETNCEWNANELVHIWTRERVAQPIFPGTSLPGPQVQVPAHLRLRWRVTWWTDRVGPITKTMSANVSRTITVPSAR